MRRAWHAPCVRGAPTPHGLALVVVTGCSSNDAQEDVVSSSDEELSVPQGDPFLSFSQMPLDAKAIALTFDDGPDSEGHTLAILDTLKSEGIHATFFVNTHNTCDIETSPKAKLALKRIVAEGHTLGNHSVHHADFSNPRTNVPAELLGVEHEVKALVPSAPRITLVRAPYGNPYFGPQSRLDYVAPIVAHHGVHVGWNIDTNDWKCADPGGGGEPCVLHNLETQLADGLHGIVLMHCIYATSASALPHVISALRARHMHFVGVEDLVVRKYGKPSAELVLGR
jgi:peptidoglycan/xylan/chitin deacetylase (PgdA/CDA1 family)